MNVIRFIKYHITLILGKCVCLQYPVPIIFYNRSQFQANCAWAWVWPCLHRGREDGPPKPKAGQGDRSLVDGRKGNWFKRLTWEWRELCLWKSGENIEFNVVIIVTLLYQDFSTTQKQLKDLLDQPFSPKCSDFSKPTKETGQPRKSLIFQIKR